jgi:hypothetical protein
MISEFDSGKIPINRGSLIISGSPNETRNVSFKFTRMDYTQHSIQYQLIFSFQLVPNGTKYSLGNLYMNDEVSMQDYILDIFYSTKGDLSKINEIIDAKLMVNQFRKITVFETYIKARLTLNPKHFKMANMNISPVEAIYLSQYPGMETVEILDLRKNGFGDEGLGGIVQSPILQNVRELDLRNNNISRVGAQMLANSETLKNLEKLDLRLNKLGKRWEEKMWESAHLLKLKEVKVA